MALTKRQREIYDFIASFVQSKGYSPSFEEIGSGMGLRSLATVHKHITNLERKGLLKRDYNRSRSIDLLPVKGIPRARSKPVESLRLPLVGRIAAGLPVETFENQETIALEDITRSKEVFVLEVRGDSMQDEHIVNGDYVMVEKVKSTPCFRARRNEKPDLPMKISRGSEFALMSTGAGRESADGG